MPAADRTEGAAYNKRRRRIARGGPAAVARAFSKEPAVARKLKEKRERELYGSSHRAAYKNRKRRGR